jgi:ribose/xylose/arabinose/galactoside ABC-type transport system permease subunit
MAVGETFVIITGGIDLSVGSLLVLSGVMTDLYCIHHGGSNASWGVIAVGSVIGLATGCAWGAVQGFLVAKGKVPSLIVTLAGFIAAGEGVAYLITGGADFRTVPNRLVNTIGLGSVLGVPWLIAISFAVAIVGGLVLAFTRFGRYTYAIGSNPEAARRAGIGVDRHLIKIYALSGLLSGLGGILSLASFDSTTIAGHAFDNLEVITAVALGGASLFGGRGAMLGYCSRAWSSSASTSTGRRWPSAPRSWPPCISISSAVGSAALAGRAGPGSCGSAGSEPEGAGQRPRSPRPFSTGGMNADQTHRDGHRCGRHRARGRHGRLRLLEQP